MEINRVVRRQPNIEPISFDVSPNENTGKKAVFKAPTTYVLLPTSHPTPPPLGDLD